MNSKELAIYQLKVEITRLQSEVARLSDPFLHAPDWANWFAVDKNGTGTLFDKEPIKGHLKEYWIAEYNSTFWFIGYYPELAANWENSKVKRVRELKS